MWLIRDTGVGKTAGLFPDQSATKNECGPCQNMWKTAAKKSCKCIQNRNFKYRYRSSTKKCSLISRVFDFFKRDFLVNIYSLCNQTLWWTRNCKLLLKRFICLPLMWNQWTSQEIYDFESWKSNPVPHNKQMIFDYHLPSTSNYSNFAINSATFWNVIFKMLTRPIHIWVFSWIYILCHVCPWLLYQCAGMLLYRFVHAFNIHFYTCEQQFN